MQATPERTSKEIIDELLKIGESAMSASLIVGFPDSTIYVQHTDERALEALEDAIRNGGNPVGYFVFLRTTEGQMEAQAFPLREYAEDQRIRDYIVELAKELIAAIEGGGAAR